MDLNGSGITSVFVLAGALLLIWWTLMLLEALRTPVETWEAAGKSKALHMIMFVVLGFIGAYFYAVLARPRLRAEGALN